MVYDIVAIPAATSSENLQALEEVKDFCTTDLGRGGHERWTYHILPEPMLSAELESRSNACSRRYVDSVTFQPCAAYATLNQDRYSIEDWDLPGGTWTFTAIFDGHCGHDTVNYVHKRLPLMIRMSLQALLQSTSNSPVNPELVSKILVNSIRHLDDSIRSDLFSLLSPEQLDNMSEAQLNQHILHYYPEWSDLSAKCTQGSTVLVALTDSQKKNLWVANLGDSQAVLGKRGPCGKWFATAINSMHNGNNVTERRRIMREHPGEQYCVSDNRVIGYLAPTRAVGDTWLKLPGMYTRRVFARHTPDWLSPTLIQQYAKRLITPPYVSNIPEIHHHSLNTNSREEIFLMLCSDGLPDLYDGIDIHLDDQQMVDRWVQIVGRSLSSRVEKDGVVPANLALRLLRDAIGGDNVELVSRNVTLEMEDKWMDDVTILIQRFQ
ncbi:phosphatase 2C-like domain-containing protein [Hygrophoropsis aurantiaca]|uniref:Phosphatase 2C-like domain-containing protein n=1 Tax=Hygrophoropsis aurantiaca TaxID=72124 RepID=A0ACB8A5S2_9AGAM|nr:phosphatase 2C-like domain-containing protein [Hygrophoropsis aurantiaca]